MADLSGKTALVTGSSRGIGRAIVIGLAEAGTEVGVNFIKNEEAGGIPVGRLGRPEEVTDAVVFLAKNGYMTGQTFFLNGERYFK
jgi:NAD(P)-dependent dehydrogenase (short-subunit alcohol dehydrogenase family)